MGEAWADVKIFVELPDGKNLAEFSLLLSKAIQDYKLALNIWHDKIEYSSLYEGRDVELLQQLCWVQAGERIKLAESLLDVENTEKALETIAALPENEKDLDAEWKKIPG